MSELFLTLLNRGIAAGWLVLAILVLRLVLKKAPKWSHVLLWGMVGIRLVCPFSLNSVLSLIPSTQVLAPEALYDPAPTIHTGISSLNNAVNPVFSQSFAPQDFVSANPLQIWTAVAGVIWAAGFCAMVLYALISWLRLRRRVREAVRLEQGIWGSEFVPSPFILGIFCPRIYVPLHNALPQAVLDHEKAHIRRKDHWWKPLGFLLLSVYWFHPLLWLAYVLLCRDIELACDEAVVKQLNDTGKADYSQALLHCSVRRSTIAACPLAFGEVDVKNRVKSVLHYKKPAFWVIAAAILACIATAVCFLTDPLEPPTLDSTAKTPLHAKPLTLEDVLTLSKKGYDLSWPDFEKYAGFDTGSGLYIRQYDIDEMFYILIGGANPENTPMYIRLCVRDGTEDSVDIRHGSYVAEFIENHKGNPLVKECSWSFYACPVGYSQTAMKTMLELGGIPKNAIVSSIESLPVVRIENTHVLQTFTEAVKDDLDLNRTQSQMHLSFLEISGTWNEAFFQERTLFLCYTTTPMLGYDYTPEYVRAAGDTLCIGVIEYEPESGDTALDGYLLAVTIPKEEVEGIKTVDARISAIEPMGGTEMANVVGYYVFRNSKEMMKPAVTLFDDGWFSLSFSMFSSYIGVGEYEIEDERLILRTNDGKFVYVFDMAGNKLIFDGKASSEMVWFSDIKDGSVFE